MTTTTPNSFNWAGFNFKNLDSQMEQINRLQLEPILLLNDYYGNPKWFWEDGSKWSEPSDKAIAEIAENAAACIEHLNGGKGGAPNYKLNVRFLEILNEPDLQAKTIPGVARLIKGVARRIHRDHPGVLVGTFGGYEMPYLPQFLEAVNPDMDWISRHPYGWTGEMVMQKQDEVTSTMKNRGLRPIPFIITEWDFWIQGPAKFDYLMLRNFETVKRENLLVTLHYRLGQYPEPIYLFGVLWTGANQERGAGPKGTPIHDAYDAFWLWRDFRGQRVDVQTASVQTGAEAKNLHADAARDGDKLNVVLYNDWSAGGGKGAIGAGSAKTRVNLQIELPPSKRARTLTLSRATGEGFEIGGAPIPVKAGQKKLSRDLEMAPLTGVSLTVQ